LYKAAVPSLVYMLQSSRGVDSRKKIQELIWTTLETVQLPIAR